MNKRTIEAIATFLNKSIKECAKVTFKESYQVEAGGKAKYVTVFVDGVMKYEFSAERFKFIANSMKVLNKVA